MPYEMNITHALLQSNFGIATQETEESARRHNVAFVNQKGRVFIVMAKTGRIRKLHAADQMQTNWKPFGQKPRIEFAIRIAKKQK